MSTTLKPEAFLLSAEQMAATKEQPAAEPIPREIEKEIQYYQFPKAVVDALIQANYAPVWALAAAIYKGWYERFQETKPGQTDLRPFG